MAENLQAGQMTLNMTVIGIEKFVKPPEVIEHDGYRVVHLTVPRQKEAVKDYVDESIKKARKLAPEIKSRGRPPWLSPDWQTRRRKMKQGVYE